MVQAGCVNNELRMSNFSKALFFSALCFMSSCVPPQHRLDFDLTRNALVSCDERIKIKNVSIWEKDENNWFKINKEKDSRGSSIVYLDKKNEGYYCNTEYPIKFKPNKEYIISSTSLDSGLEMSVFTNSEGKIDSVSNRFGCLKEN